MKLSGRMEGIGYLPPHNGAAFCALFIHKQPSFIGPLQG
jgi:hypothetical protein